MSSKQQTEYSVFLNVIKKLCILDSKFCYDSNLINF